jgi:hypothetical protein
LFKYETTVRNTSELGIDDFAILVNLPADTSVATTQSSITSHPPELIEVIDIASVDRTPTKQEYKVSLLNPGQSLTFSYYAYAAEAMTPPSMAVLVQKRDWIQTVGLGAPPRPTTTTDRPDPVPYMIAFAIGVVFNSFIASLGRAWRRWP